MDTSDTVQTRRKTPRRKLSPEAKQLLKGKLPIIIGTTPNRAICRLVFSIPLWYSIWLVFSLELTKKASMPTLKRCHIATTEAEYLARLMQKHAGDCTVRDYNAWNSQQLLIHVYFKLSFLFPSADGTRQAQLSANDRDTTEKEMLCSTRLKRASSPQSARTDRTATNRMMNTHYNYCHQFSKLVTLHTCTDQRTTYTSQLLLLQGYHENENIYIVFCFSTTKIVLI